MNIDPSDNIIRLEISTFNNLTKILDKNDDWIKLARYFELFDTREIRLLSMISSPGSKLLNELGNKLCSVETLTGALRECELYDALALLVSPEKIKIVKQPTESLSGRDCLKIINGDELKLVFIVSGIPPPKFTWFKDNIRLPGHNTNTFLCDNFKANNEGIYYCVACQTLPDDEVEQVKSDEIKIEILPYCKITHKPQELTCVKEGSTIFLKVEADGHPNLNYQWIHGNSILDTKNNFVYIEQSRKQDGGEYRCVVSNVCKEICVKSNVIVYAENTFPVFKDPVPAKVALLIGNGDYTNHHHLATPTNDVETLAQILTDLGFAVCKKFDLTLNGMRDALRQFKKTNLRKDALVFFYYAGHGFQIRSNYLMPVDAPVDHPCKDTMCDDEILETVLDTHPSLFICLLDMCLSLPNISNNPEIFIEEPEPRDFKSDRNLIRGWATTSHYSSYEKKNVKNGIYMNVLSKYLKQDDPPLPILTILEKVNADFDADRTIKKVQIPSFYTNAAQNYYLNLELLKMGVFD